MISGASLVAWLLFARSRVRPPELTAIERARQIKLAELQAVAAEQRAELTRLHSALVAGVLSAPRAFFVVRCQYRPFYNEPGCEHAEIHHKRTTVSVSAPLFDAAVRAHYGIRLLYARELYAHCTGDVASYIVRQLALTLHTISLGDDTEDDSYMSWDGDRPQQVSRRCGETGQWHHSRLTV